MPFPSKNVLLYGMPLPYQFDRKILFRNMLYYVEELKIMNYVDLHDCEGWTNFTECNPYDISIEREMFDLVIKWRNKQELLYKPRKYINIRGYVDMTPGSYLAWHKISEIPDTTINRTLIHCYAGLGRTGSVLLFLLLRDQYNVFNLQQPHFNARDILSLIDNLSKLFEYDLTNYNRREDIVYELFNTTNFIRICILQQRLNRIFFFLAKNKKLPYFYLYRYIDPDPNIIDNIIERKRAKGYMLNNKLLEEAYLEYGIYAATKKDVLYHFSKPVKYHMNWDILDSYDIEYIEREVLNGYGI